MPQITTVSESFVQLCKERKDELRAQLEAQKQVEHNSRHSFWRGSCRAYRCCDL